MNDTANQTTTHRDDPGYFHVGPHSAIAVVGDVVYEARHSGAFANEHNVVAGSALVQGF